MSSDKDTCKDDNLIEIELEKDHDNNEHKQYNKQINHNVVRQNVIIKQYYDSKLETEFETNTDNEDDNEEEKNL